MPKPYTDTELLDFLAQQAAAAGIRIESPCLSHADWRVGDEQMACDHSFPLSDQETMGAGASLREALSAALSRVESGHG